MPSIIPGYEYDIFISYRQKDNKQGGWVTEFINSLKNEIEATFKQDISIYFDENPHDGLHEHHEVDGSLQQKLKCLILIPIVSQTYCDPNAFAWRDEFKVFIKQAEEDNFGLKIRLSNGNVANRVLPVRIHEIDDQDRQMFEKEIQGVMRSIDFIYRETGVNRPLNPTDERSANLEKTDYRNQVNKVANAIKEILSGLQHGKSTIQSQDISEPKSRVKNEDTPIVHGKKKVRKKFKVTQRIVNRLLQIAAILIVIVSSFLFGRLTIDPPDSNPLMLRYEIRFGEDIDWLGAHAFDVSTDGKFVVISGYNGLSIKNLDDVGPAIPISGTEQSVSPEISPDGKWVAFYDFVNNNIMKVPIGGGTPSKICEAGRGLSGMNWCGRNIIFAQDGIIYKVMDSGGSPERIYPASNKDPDSVIWNPQMLPDNETLLFNRYNGSNQWDIRTWKINSKENSRTVVKRGTDVRYLKSGHITYTRDERLYISEFDIKTGVIGEAQLLPNGKLSSYGRDSRTAQYAFSDNGILLYYENPDQGSYHVVWVDKNGKDEEITKEILNYDAPAISPDGDDIVVDLFEQSETTKSLIVNVSLGTSYLFAEDAKYPIWNRDGKSIIYQTRTDEVMQQFLEMGREPRMLFRGELREIGNLSDDGRYLVFSTGSRLGYYDMETDTTVILEHYSGDFTIGSPAISPDGKWVVYESLQRGNAELYVVKFPGPGPRYKISERDAHFAAWAPDQSAIYYNEHSQTGSELYEVKLNLEEEFSSESPQALFYGRFHNGYAGRFSISPDGKKFLMVKSLAKSVQSKLNVVVNWQSELEKTSIQ